MAHLLVLGLCLWFSIFLEARSCINNIWKSIFHPTETALRLHWAVFRFSCLCWCTCLCCDVRSDCCRWSPGLRLFALLELRLVQPYTFTEHEPNPKHGYSGHTSPCHKKKIGMLLGEIFVYWGHTKHTIHRVGIVQNFVMLKQLVTCGYHCAVEKWINPIFVILFLSVQITHMMRHWRYSKRC
jgi:hypothetical protein